MSVFDSIKGAATTVTSATGSAINGARSTLGDAGKSLAGFASDVGVPSSVISGAQQVASDVTDSLGSEIIGAVTQSGPLGGLLGGLFGSLVNGQSAKVTWGNLNPKLIAQLFACDKKRIQVPTEPSYVLGPISEATLELTQNWQSPFEGAGPESKAPMLAAMLQSGQFGTVLNAISDVLPSEMTGGSVSEQAQQTLNELENRTGITRLNSRQVFTGMLPMRINMTLHLRAVRDSEKELMTQYKRLLSWTLPQQLYADGVLAGVIRQAGEARTLDDAAKLITALFPSIAPLMVAMNYGGQAFPPMVIETVGHPLDAPRDATGRYVYLPVQVQLATLTALDRTDIAKMFT